MKTPPEHPSPVAVGRVLVVRLDNIGDVVLTAPLVVALREEFGASHVAFLASPGGAPAAKLISGVDEVVSHRAVWQELPPGRSFEPADLREVIEHLAGRFDVALICTSARQSPVAPALVAFLAGIPVRVGHHTETFAGCTLTHRAAPLDATVHHAERNLHLLSALATAREPIVGGTAPDPASGGPALTVPRAVRLRVAQQLSALDVRRSYVVVAPGASCTARRYPPDRFAEVARTIPTQMDRDVVVVGSASDAPTCELMRLHTDDTDRIHWLNGRTDLAELAALIEGADAAVVNNSGPMHIADAMRTPSVVLYSGTELHSQWEPRTATAVVITRETPCAPCYRFDCDRALACLDIPAAEVVDELASILSRDSFAESQRVGATKKEIACVPAS